MKNRILSMLLTLCMILTFVPATAVSAEEATVDIVLGMRAIDEEGNVISGTLDVLLNNVEWLATTYDPLVYSCNVGENYLSNWDYCPAGYVRPTEDVTFTADAEGNITVTSNNATVVVEDGVAYFVVTLASQPTASVNMALRGKDVDGNPLSFFEAEINGNIPVSTTPTVITCSVGENTMATWIVPNEFQNPLEDIVFNVDEDGNVEIVSGDATVATEDGVTYFDFILYKVLELQLTLKAVDADGNPIDGTLDAVCNNSGWVSTDAVSPFDVLIGPNKLSGWDLCPEGYAKPTEDIEFTVNEAGEVAVTGGNATVEVVDDVVYIVVPLQSENEAEAHEHTYLEGYYLWEDDGHYKKCDTCDYYDEASFEAHSDENADTCCDVCEHDMHVHSYLEGWYDFDDNWHYIRCDNCNYYDEATRADHIDEDADYYCDLCWATMPHEHTYLDGYYNGEEDGHYKECDICSYYDEASFEAHADADSNDVCDACSRFLGNYTLQFYRNDALYESGPIYYGDKLTAVYSDTVKYSWIIYDHSLPGEEGTIILSDANTLIMDPEILANINSSIYLSIYNPVNHETLESKVFDPVSPILEQPEFVEIAPGKTASFHVAVEGEWNYKWQYSLNNGNSWFACKSLEGKNSDTLYVPATAARDGFLYRCVLTNANGFSMISDYAQLNLDYLNSAAIISQPEFGETSVGSISAITVEAQGAGLTYKWQYSVNDGKAWLASKTFEGRNTDTLYVPVTTARDGFLYRCVITDENGYTVISNAVRLTLPVQNSIVITGHPVFAEPTIGETSAICVDAEGEGLTYKWQYSLNGGVSWFASKSFEGKNTDTLYVPVTAARDGFLYRCVITDANGYVEISDVAELNVQ